MDGTLTLWDVTQAEAVQICEIRDSHRSPSNHGLEAVDGQSSAIRALVCMHVGGELLLVSGSFDRNITVWKPCLELGLVKTQMLVDEQCPSCAEHRTAHRGSVTAIVCGHVTEGSDQLISGSEDGSIKLWEALNGTGTGKVLLTIRYPGTGVCSLAWIGHQNLLACGFGNGNIHIYDPALGVGSADPHDDAEHRTRVQTLGEHRAGVHALLRIEAKGWLVSAAADAVIMTWR